MSVNIGIPDDNRQKVVEILNTLLADEFDDEVGESGYASRFLDYYPRSERRQVWDIVRETAYNPGMVLLIGLLTLMSGGEAGIISILLISIFTGPMIWLAFRGLGHMRSMSSRRNLVLC